MRKCRQVFAPKVGWLGPSRIWKEPLWDKFVTEPRAVTRQAIAWQICREGAHAVRAAIQGPQASTAALSRDLGIAPETVAKQRKRDTVEDRKPGPKELRSTGLSNAEEAMVVAFRRLQQ